MTEQEILDNGEIWINTVFKDWLKSYYDLNIQVAKTSNEILIQISRDIGIDYDYLELSIEDLKEILDSNLYILDSNIGIKNILKQNKNLFYILFKTEDAIFLDKYKTNYSLNRNKSKTVESSYRNRLNYSLLKYFVERNIELYINPDKIVLFFNGSLEFLNIFEINYLECNFSFDFNFDKLQNDNIFFSILHCFNESHKTNFTLLNIEDLKEEDFYSAIEIPVTCLPQDENLFSHDPLPVIYYLAAIQHDDARFTFLDFYHVIEYFFDEIQLKNVQDILEKELKTSNIIYDSNHRTEVSKSIKKVFLEDEKNMSEFNILTSICKEYIKSYHFKSLSSDVTELKKFEKFTKISLLLQQGISTKQKEEAEKILYSEISTRIYKIRNSIAHSKSVDFKILPHSLFISFLENDIKLIKNLCQHLLQIFSSPFEL